MTPDRAPTLDRQRIGEHVMADVHHMRASVCEWTTNFGRCADHALFAADRQCPSTIALSWLDQRVWIGNRCQ
jgi:hypothetical protein